MIKRYLEKYVLDDLKDKMVFISGPRQIGKTTLAKQISNKFFPGKYAYLNWDNRQDRKLILNESFPADKDLIVFDEIHKYRKWKNYLKGEYDKHKQEFQILVTGSARLDVYKKGGDSLLGRYHPYRLHPLSLHELSSTEIICNPFKELVFSDENTQQKKLFNRLFKFGGFPEIFIKQSEKTLRRWHNARIDRVIKDDIRDIENLRDISALQVLVELLPGKTGSLFSLNSLREDLGVTHKTVSLWVDILEQFYYHFRIYPFQTNVIKSLRKEPKLYLWDWSEIGDENVRFENIIASHLLKFCHFLFDAEGYKAQLYYLRDKEQREVDFLITVGNKVWFCVEVKATYKDIPASLKYFGEKLKIPFIYEVVKEGNIDFIKDNIRVISASKFLSALV
ncbi:MAG: ATP-binding protein [Candidatus Ratteibacteria bacterium]|nr:ATP-binding protein [Candidatus Ratteibacteria bacterium]